MAVSHKRYRLEQSLQIIASHLCCWEWWMILFCPLGLQFYFKVIKLIGWSLSTGKFINFYWHPHHYLFTSIFFPTISLPRLILEKKPQAKYWKAPKNKNIKIFKFCREHYYRWIGKNLAYKLASQLLGIVANLNILRFFFIKIERCSPPLTQNT